MTVKRSVIVCLYLMFILSSIMLSYYGCMHVAEEEEISRPLFISGMLAMFGALLGAAMKGNKALYVLFAIALSLIMLFISYMYLPGW